MVIKRWMRLEGIGVVSGCCCKEVYIDILILLFPTPLVLALFLQQHSYIFLNVFRSCKN